MDTDIRPNENFPSVTNLISENNDFFICPKCEGHLKLNEANGIECIKCNQRFNTENGIPLLFWPTEQDSGKRDVTDIVKSFYEKTPFPNYNDLDSVSSLRAKAEKSVFARLLDEQIPYDAKILEVGCGTGQLSNYLSIAGQRTMFGADMCLNSLKLGNDFRQKNSLNKGVFHQMNLFRPVFKPGSFDFVISNGVLLTTNDPYAAFRSISRLVKKDGYIIIGLYNTFGRLITDLRRIIFRITGDRFLFLDPRFREALNDARKKAWLYDQYKHPHETKQTFGEVLKWFDESGVEFICSIPKCKAFDSFSPNEELFKKHQQGTMFDCFIVQLGMIFTGSYEGGFFTMIGRKKS